MPPTSQPSTASFLAWKDEDFYYSPEASHIYLYGPINVQTVNKFRADLHKGSNHPIVIHVHSQGGAASLGITIANMIREVSVPVAVVVDGYACSAVTALLVTAPYRVMHEFSFVLLHEISMSFRHDVVIKKADLDFKGEDLSATLAEYRRIYQNNTKIPSKILDELLSRDMFLDASNCSKYKIVDRVVRLDKKRGEKRWVQTNYPLQENRSKINPSSWQPAPKHLFMMANSNKANNTYNTNAANPSDASLLNIIKSLHIAAKQKTTIERPMLLHANSFFTPSASWFDIATLLAHTYCNKAPVISVIDSDLDIIKALPTIVSYKRFMYDNAYVTISLLFDHKVPPARYYHDIKYNTELLRDALKKILKRYTKLPQSLLQSLFDKRIILNAKQCKDYGLIDHIIPAATKRSTVMRPKQIQAKHTKQTQAGMKGGCGCSQGLAYDIPT